MSTLQDKNAVVFGAGGTIGAAVAKTLATEGARVFLTGRTKASVGWPLTLFPHRREMPGNGFDSGPLPLPHFLMHPLQVRARSAASATSLARR
jgi:nucleoside-diphosphate-sugar epimerase